MGIWVYVKDEITQERMNINTDDCDFITILNEKTMVFVKGNRRYIEVRGLENYSDELEKQGFELTDRSHLVNMKRTAYFDEKELELYFEHPPTEASISASVARIHKKHIKSIMEALGKLVGPMRKVKYPWEK